MREERLVRPGVLVQEVVDVAGRDEGMPDVSASRASCGFSRCWTSRCANSGSRAAIDAALRRSGWDRAAGHFRRADRGQVGNHRDEMDAFGHRSQRLATQSREGRIEREIIAITGADGRR